MARKRNVFALRQALASDVNEQNDFRIVDYKNIIKNVIGTSKGVVTGLTATYSGLNLTVALGSVCDTETIYELLTNTVLAVPSTSGTYKIYAQYSSTNDLPIAGFQLLDIDTREETYNTVNTRTYDSITLGSTLSTIPVDSELLGEATVSGGEITAYDDQRAFITTANLVAYTLQELINQDKTTSTETNYYTGEIGDPTSKSFIKIEHSNTSASSSIIINNGTNASTIGINISANANTSFKSSNSSGAIGYSSIGINTTNTIGFKASNNLTNYRADLLASTTGMYMLGVNSDDIGLNIEDIQNGIKVTNTNQNDFESNVITYSGQIYSSGQNNPENASFGVKGIESRIRNTGIGYVANWFQTTLPTQQFVGFQVYNNSSQNGGVGFQVLNALATSTDKLSLGFMSVGNLLSEYLAVSNQNVIGYNSIRGEDGINGSEYLSSAFSATLKDNTTGLSIFPESGSIALANGIDGRSIDSDSKFNTFILAQDYATGISLTGIDTLSEVGMYLYNNRTAMNIGAASSTNAVGINIFNQKEGVVISGSTTAIKLDSGTNSGLLINGTDTSGYGIQINNKFRAIDIIDASTALNIKRNTTMTGNAVVLNLGGYQAGISVENAKGSGIRFDMSGDTGSYQTNIQLSELSGTNPACHITCATPPTTLPVSGISGKAVLQMHNDGLGGGYKLKFWDGGAWITVV